MAHMALETALAPPSGSALTPRALPGRWYAITARTEFGENCGSAKVMALQAGRRNTWRAKLRAVLTVAAATVAVFPIGPSRPGYALDVSVSVGGGLSAGGGATVGGISAGADVSAGGSGVSAGGNVNPGDSGVSAAGNVSAGGRGISASGEASGEGGSASTGAVDGGGASAGGDLGGRGSGVSDEEKSTKEVRGTVARTSPGRKLAISLPAMLRPRCAFTSEGCGGEGDDIPPGASAVTVAGGIFGASLPEAVTVCRDRIAKDAAQIGALKVDAYSAGRVRQSSTGGQIASLTVRIEYPGEVKEAPVECYLDAGGSVVALRVT
jgi:hypothetical protein